MKVRTEITKYLCGLTQKQTDDIERVVKTLLTDQLKRSTRKVYDKSNESEQYLILQIFNDIQKEVNNG